MKNILYKLIPTWLRHYQKQHLSDDVIAGIVVGILVIPQNLAYAVMAGLPPEYGLYTSLLPVLVYVYFGTSNIQAVGPVAITAIMTASSLSMYADQGAAVYTMMASVLALMVGMILWLAGRLRLGWITQFISRGVNSGFVSAAALLIFVSQLKYMTSIPLAGSSITDYSYSLYHNYHNLSPNTLLLSSVVLTLLLLNSFAKKWVWQTWLTEAQTLWVSRLFPLLVLLVGIGLSGAFHWADHGIHVIGTLPNQLPHFAIPQLPFSQWIDLLGSAVLMALVVFISSNSVTSFYDNQSSTDTGTSQQTDANAELQALGFANISSGVTQGFTIAGGFSRTALNVSSGAKTPVASIMTVGVMLIVLLFLSKFLSPLPYAFLGAIIMVAVIRMFDIATFKGALIADRLDAFCLFVTFMVSMLFGLNVGLVVGLLTSFAGLIWQSSKPHIAIVGVLNETEHFRNIERHNVQTFDNLLILRIDERMFFGNSEAIRQTIIKHVESYTQADQIILMMSAVNHVDFTAQKMLESLNDTLIDQDKTLHFSEIKGPVMDVLKQTALLKNLSGNVYLSTIKAVRELAK